MGLGNMKIVVEILEGEFILLTHGSTEKNLNTEAYRYG